MPRKCSAYNCKSSDNGKYPGITFHLFPKDPILRSQWVKASKRIEPDNPMKVNWAPGRYTYLCSLHFKSEDFIIYNRCKCLRRTAVPSIFSFNKSKPSSARSERYSSSYLPLTASIIKPPDDVNGQLLERVNSHRNKLRNSGKREKRLRLTIQSLMSELGDLKLANKELEAKLYCFKDLPTDLFTKEHNKYSDRMKNFALTLSLYGSKAYDYCRSVLSLPHPVTLRRWLSHYNGKPGFTMESVDHLKKMSASGNLSYQQCSLMADAMNIKKYLEYDHQTKQYVGHVNFGSAIESDSDLLATDALVIMAVGIQGYWKLPIGYFLINGCTAAVQTSLLLQCISLLHSVGVDVVSLTLDGHPSNMSTIRMLGCSTKTDTLSTSFPHPETGKLIGVFIDACHSLKLVRNHFESLQEIHMPGVGVARWKDLIYLNEIQKRESLSVANKLSDRHVNFAQQKMKVSLAAQTLSSSVAKALEFLIELDLMPEASRGTAHFIHLINRVFDVLNVRHPNADGYKSPVTRDNIEAFTKFHNSFELFLLALEAKDGDKLVCTRKATGFLGLIFCLRSLENVTKRLFQETSMKYVLSYKFSQDDLELFFNSIRRSCGWNNNPTCKQFSDIYRRFIAHAGVQPSSNGNCLDFSDEVIDDPIEELAKPRNLNPYLTNICAYISGYIVKKIMAHIRCSDCRAGLLTTDFSELDPEDRCLLVLKNNGGLTLPSKDVIHIVKLTESVIRSMPESCKVNFSSVCSTVMQQLTFMSKYNCFHFYDDRWHFSEIVKSIVSCYLNIRVNHLCKSLNLERYSKRFQYNKLVLYSSM